MPGQVKVWRDFEHQQVHVQTDEGCFVFTEEFIAEYFPPDFSLTLQDLLDLTKKMVGQWYQPPKLTPVKYNMGFSIIDELMNPEKHDGKYHVVEVDGILYPTRD